MQRWKRALRSGTFCRGGIKPWRSENDVVLSEGIEGIISPKYFAHLEGLAGPLIGLVLFYPVRHSCGPCGPGASGRRIARRDLGNHLIRPTRPRGAPGPPPQLGDEQRDAATRFIDVIVIADDAAAASGALSRAPSRGGAGGRQSDGSRAAPTPAGIVAMSSVQRAT